METKMHDDIPLLTGYLYQGVNYAWHAWYSSRIIELSPQDSLDGLPVSWLQEVRKLTLKRMEQIHEAALARKNTLHKGTSNYFFKS